MFSGIVAAVLKMAAILNLSKATKIVNDNYPLQSGQRSGFIEIEQKMPVYEGECG
jgi:hypothetical protein